MKIKPVVLALLILSFAGVVWVYPSLPAQVPTHWGLSGEVTDYSARSTLLLLGLLPIAIYLMMAILPKMDPKREAYRMHRKAYEITRTAVSLLLAAMVWISILVAKGVSLDVGLLVSMATGLLFILMGNYMGQIRHNYFFGIRTPWTLANETVWRKTHRLGGYCFILMGLGIILVNLMRASAPAWALPGLIALGVLVPFAYSYFIYKREVFDKEEQ